MLTPNHWTSREFLVGIHFQRIPAILKTDWKTTQEEVDAQAFIQWASIVGWTRVIQWKKRGVLNFWRWCEGRQICWCWHGVRGKKREVWHQLFWPQHLEKQSCTDWDETCEKVLQGRSGTSSYMPGGSQRCPSDCLEMFLNSSPAAAAQKSMTEGIPWGSVARTPSFRCWGHGFNLWSGN